MLSSIFKYTCRGIRSTSTLCICNASISKEIGKGLPSFLQGSQTQIVLALRIKGQQIIRLTNQHVADFINHISVNGHCTIVSILRKNACRTAQFTDGGGLNKSLDQRTLNDFSILEQLF